MSKVITFSRTFPSYHPKAGQPTYFVEKVVKSLHKQGVKPFDVNCDFSEEMYHIIDPKHHTIRAGHRFKVGEWFSPRVWSGRPYNSKQIQFAPDIQVNRQWDFDLINGKVIIGGLFHCSVKEEEKIEAFACNDGLSAQDLLDWFQYPKPCADNQIICWNENINY